MVCEAMRQRGHVVSSHGGVPHPAMMGAMTLGPLSAEPKFVCRAALVIDVANRCGTIGVDWNGPSGGRRSSVSFRAASRRDQGEKNA
jgi:hypothetical protein